MPGPDSGGNRGNPAGSVLSGALAHQVCGESDIPQAQEQLDLGEILLRSVYDQPGVSDQAHAEAVHPRFERIQRALEE